MKKSQTDISKAAAELDVESLEAELQREKYKKRYGRVLKSTIYALITVAAAAVLVATLWMPVLQIYGSSMSPKCEDADGKDNNLHRRRGTAHKRNKEHRFLYCPKGLFAGGRPAAIRFVCTHGEPRQYAL